MFDFVRNHTRLVLGFMLLLIIPSFIFFGVDGYSRFSGGGNDTVATVDGRPITRAEWDAAHQRYVDNLRRQSPTMDVARLNTPEMRRATLEGLMNERVLMTAAQAMHLAPSDERLQQLFRSDAQFAQMRNPDGSVNRELLAMQGRTSEMFAQELRQVFAMQQVTGGITSSAFAPASVSSAALDPLFQRRVVQVQRFDAAAYRDRVQPSDAEVEAFYKANAARFKAPEQAEIQYVVLSLAEVGRAVQVGEEELRKFYADNSARFTAAEERQASHVLVKADKDMPAAERAKAKARAQALLAEVRKNPAAFADLARKNSEDPGSAAQGGDLGYFGRGAMVKAFEDTAFAMKRGDISDVFETDFGYHFLTLTGVRGGQKKAFEEVRGEIEAELRKSQALRRWPEMAEQFTNLVYEQPESLKPVTDKLKLEIKTATVLRTPAPGAKGPLASSKLLEAVFGNEAVANKRNTDAVEVGANELISARVVNHLPARTLPLAEVGPRVRDELVGTQSAALARKEGEAAVAALRLAGARDLPAVQTVSRAQPQGLPRPALDAALQADAGKLPQPVGVELPGQGYVVLRVMQVLPREAAPGGDESLRAQYVQSLAAAESDAYQQALKVRFKAELKGAADAAPAASAAQR
jgi:peptidyl-prolyl cis-trans isomerase D